MGVPSSNSSLLERENFSFKKTPTKRTFFQSGTSSIPRHGRQLVISRNETIPFQPSVVHQTETAKRGMTWKRPFFSLKSRFMNL